MEVQGPAGALELKLDDPPSPDGRIAVLCHPHPQYGGNMDDGVLQCLVDALVGVGIGCLRFNFRGVGRSAGSTGDGAGELDDLCAVIDWLNSTRPARSVWLGGYSFGANIAWRGLARGIDAERLLLLAPPIGTMDFAELDSCKVDVFAGDADQYIDHKLLDAFVASTQITLHVLAGADHFFSGQWDVLTTTIEDSLTGWTSDI